MGIRAARGFSLSKQVHVFALTLQSKLEFIATVFLLDFLRPCSPQARVDPQTVKLLGRHYGLVVRRRAYNFYALWVETCVYCIESETGPLVHVNFLRNSVI